MLFFLTCNTINLMAQLEVELAYNGATVQYGNHYTTGISPLI